MKKYFDILELDMSASIEAVEKAYKELAEAWRPENYQNLPRFKRKAEIKLKEVNDAYERIRTYLQIKETGEDQIVSDLPIDIAPKPEADAPSAEETPPVQTGAPSRRKNLLPAVMIVAAVLSALIFYLISDFQESQKPKPQPITVTETKSAIDTEGDSPPGSADHAPKGIESNSAAASGSDKPSTFAKPAALKKTAAGIRTDYDGLITQEALSRYNRNPVRVKQIQNGLITVGYNTGPIDGVIGPQTTAALKKFANDRGHAIEAGGLFTSDLTNVLLVFAEVSAEHPDWDRIISSEDFARWLDSQKVMPPYQIKKLKKSPTARRVVEMLDFYRSGQKTP
jgi:hypothetical protein